MRVKWCISRFERGNTDHRRRINEGLFTSDVRSRCKARSGLSGRLRRVTEFNRVTVQ